MKRSAVLLLAPLLLGCAENSSAVHGVSTAAVAAALGSAGGPLVGFVAGLAVGYAVDQGVKYGERAVQENAQQAIADTAGPLDPGKGAEWIVTESFPVVDRRGLVEVARAFGEAIPCKEIVFSVSDNPEFFTATICRDKTERWRWALAEPTVHRWGTLQ
jgi:hypothetical protein